MKNKKGLSENIKRVFGKHSKVENQEFVLGENSVSVFYIESLIDKKLVSSGVLEPLQKQAKNNAKTTENTVKISLELLKQEVFAVSSIEDANSVEDAVVGILDGKVCVVLDEEAILIPVFGAQKRGIEEPPTSRVVKGPREGFVEDIGTNVGLVRKRLKTPNLQIEDVFIGKQTHSRVSLFYLKDIARPDIVEAVKQKLETINIDAIIDSYYIESFLEDNKVKFFRRVGNTEKPDIFCAKILEGRVGLIVDGSPVALTVPFVFFEDLQSSQDYYTIPAMASFARVMRLFELIYAVLAPAIYVALQSYNYRILPINFLITLLSSIESLSIPPLIEILIVLFLFEVITEASLQMPNSMGMALSIIGALALGNTAVDAGIISPPSIVVVATSSVALYSIPDEIAQTRLLRILFTIAGGVIGLYGIICSFMILVAYIVSIKSFGVPYLSPYAPSVRLDKNDGFIKHSIQDLKRRPTFLADKNKIRQRTDRGGK
ncbi:MAG: spore germination protein [Clostridiales bacterium]|nr:spore germination protein [Clostridiales bacterium]